MNLTTLSAADELPALIVPQIGRFEVTITEQALMARKDAIELSQSIVSVESIKERDDAIAALSLVKGLLKSLEATRTEVKRPVIDAGNAIDKAAKSYADALKIEQVRVEKLTNAYQLKCNQAAAELRDAELKEIAQQNQGADIDTLRANAERQIELCQKVTVEGAMTKEYFEYDILPGGLMELAQQRPDLVSLEPRRREILAAISNGALIPGLRVYKTVKVMAKAS